MRNEMAKTHGMRKSLEYKSWASIKQRCINVDNKRYSDYGGRGIGICDRWLNFENFFTDMGLKPSPAYSIDRINNDGDYCPENCRWTTREIQANNTRRNHLITIEGETRTMAQWSKKMNLGESVIKRRLQGGWSEKDAVMTPLEIVKLITIEEETYTVSQWEEKKGYSRELIKTRLTRGWSEKDAVLIPVGGKRNR